MVFWLTSLYFLIYFLLAVGITRVRAEVGPPTHEMFVANPRQFIIDTLGSRRIPAQSLAMMSLFFSFNRGYRAHPMPHTLEGFKIAEELKIKYMGLAMMAAVVIGILTVFCLYLTIAYQIGANPSLGSGAYDLLRRWLYYSSASETNGPAVLFMLFGFCFTGVIWWARIRLPAWPFHPAGYAVASSIYQLADQTNCPSNRWRPTISPGTASVLWTPVRSISSGWRMGSNPADLAPAGLLFL